MKNIKKLYLTDENQRPVAVQIDINDFNKIEQIIEDHALGKLIEENDPAEYLSENEAKDFYDQIKRNEP